MILETIKSKLEVIFIIFIIVLKKVFIYINILTFGNWWYFLKRMDHKVGQKQHSSLYRWKNPIIRKRQWAEKGKKPNLYLCNIEYSSLCINYFLNDLPSFVKLKYYLFQIC